jgi:hypothetical protein
MQRRKRKKRGSGWMPVIIAVLIGGSGIITIILNSGGNNGKINLFSTTATPTARILTYTPSATVSSDSVSTQEPTRVETSELIPATAQPDSIQLPD